MDKQMREHEEFLKHLTKKEKEMLLGEIDFEEYQNYQNACFLADMNEQLFKAEPYR